MASSRKMLESVPYDGDRRYNLGCEQEKLSPENAVDELKSLSTGKIKLKSKKSQSNLPMVFDSTAIVTQ